MGNYEQLKQAVSDVIKTNENREITGGIMQNTLLSIISTIGNNATFAGIARPTTNPGTPDQNVFWIAPYVGIYPNFGGLEVYNEVSIFINKNGNWGKILSGIPIKKYYYNQVQLRGTFVWSGYISQDSSEHPLTVYKDGDGFQAVIFNPAKNGKYIVENFVSRFTGTIRFYKGDIANNPTFVSELIIADRTEFTTPNSDYDFALVNVGGTSSGLPYLGGMRFYMSENIKTYELQSKFVNHIKIAAILNQVQLRGTFVWSGYISQDSSEHPLTVYKDGDGFQAVIFNPAKNGKYIVENFVSRFTGTIRFYKGDIANNPTFVSELIIADRTEFTTPNSDYDFALVNVGGTSSGLPYLGGMRFYMSEEETPDYTNQWYGKKIVWLGTSVPYGSNTFNYESYASYAAKKLGFDIVPAVIPGEAIHAKLEDGVIKPLTYGSTVLSKEEYQNAGWTIPNKPLVPWMPGSENNSEHPGTGYNNYYRTWENVFNSENADADLYIFDVAPNNTNFDETDWNMFDYSNWRYTDDSDFSEHRTTFIGAILFLMNKMYDINPNARMVFVLGSAFAYDSAKQNMQKISEKWNIPIIDIWQKINTSPKSLSVIKSKNGTDNHPSDFGHEMLGNIITNELLLIS